VYFEHHHQTALFVSLMVLLAALAKSAQFPFSSWLPRAMEGPTPSSAVFYGSLSVHLGAYLLMRTHTFWEMLPEVKVLIGFLGLTTAVSGTLISRTQSTIKGQIAYSSSAQIGMMFMEIALGLHSLVLIHFVGNALLRTYQLLVSPSVVTYLIRDQFFHFEPKPVAPAKSRWVHRLKSSLYLLSLKEWNLDHLVFSVLLYPLKRLKKILNPIPNPLFLLMTTMIMLLSTFWLPFEKAEWAGVDNEFARSATSTVLGIWAMLLMVKAYNERGSVFYGWTWILLGNLLVLRSTQWRVEINDTEAALFLGGIILSSSVGYAVLLILRAQLKQMPDLNAYWGLIHTKPALGFFFLMSGLGMSGFPITTTFLGQDLLLSHIEEGDFVMATLLALSFVLNGISIIRMYARVFLGHHQKSYLHPTPQTL
jgi:formate hydrogenlyase subunit 3/multisubunit Na+/H+ antiporter MnhD subunit